MINPLQKIIAILLTSVLFIACNNEVIKETKILSKEIPFALVIHGGAGTIKKEYMTPEMEVAYTNKLQEALDAGYQVLENGGNSNDEYMRNNSLF